jgi:hypothetical protein
MLYSDESVTELMNRLNGGVWCNRAIIH